MTHIRLSFAPGWSYPVIFLVTVAALASVYWFYQRVVGTVPRKQLQTLLILRVVAMTVLLLCLFRPVLSFQKTLSKKTGLLMLLDTSKSMSICDFPNLPGRLERVKGALFQDRGLIKRVENEFDLAWHSFSSYTKKLESRKDITATEPVGDTTDMARAVKEAIGQRERGGLTGVLLFTDGVDNVTNDPTQALAALGVPVYPVGVGSKLIEQKNFKDILISKVEAKRTVSVKVATEIKVFVEAIGFGDNVVPILLKRDGLEVAREKIVLDNKQGNQVVSIKYTPDQTGQFTFEASIPTDPAERIRENNANTFPVLVTDPKINVLYVEAKLRWEYKFLRRTLQQDPNIDLASLVKTGPTTFYQQDAIESIKLEGFPKTKELMRKFDVIIIGDVDRSHFTNEHFANLKAAVSEGTAFLMIGGYGSFGPGGFTGTAVEEILPVTMGGRDIGQEKDPFLIKVTDEGMVHPVFAGCQQFFTVGVRAAEKVVPELLGCNIVEKGKPGASLLAVHPTKKTKDGAPLVVLAVQKYGNGRTAAFTVDTTWRWYFPLRGMGKESPYVKFWGQMVRWLAGREKTEKETKPGVLAYTDKNYYEPGERARIFAHVNDDQGQATNEAVVNVTFTGPGNKQTKVSIPYLPGSQGEYEADFTPPGPGEYKGEVVATLKGKALGKAELKFQFGKPNLEFEKLDLNEDMLKRLADATGGQYFSLVNIDKLADSLERRLRTRTLYREIDFWNSSVFGLSPSAYVFAAFIALVTAEWVLRKRRHLS